MDVGTFRNTTGLKQQVCMSVPCDLYWNGHFECRVLLSFKSHLVIVTCLFLVRDGFVDMNRISILSVGLLSSSDAAAAVPEDADAHADADGDFDLARQRSPAAAGGATPTVCLSAAAAAATASYSPDDGSESAGSVYDSDSL